MVKESFNEIGSTVRTLKWFSFMVLTSQLAGVIAVIIVAIFFGQYRGGFAWTVRFLLNMIYLIFVHSFSCS